MQKNSTGNLAYDAYVNYNRAYNKSLSRWEKDFLNYKLPESKTVKNTATSTIKAVAHRGNSSSDPENTLIAFVLAKVKGFTFAECDVRWTKDGVAVLLHDANISRTSNSKGELSALNYEKVEKLDFGKWKNSKFKNTKIPTFEEFLSLFSFLNLHPYIDIKENPGEEKLEELLTLISSYQWEEKYAIISFNFEVLQIIKEKNNKMRLGYLTSIYSDKIKSDTISLKTEENEIFLNLSHEAVSKQIVNDLSAHDIKVEMWTVNDMSKLASLKTFGVSGITSDDAKATQLLT